MSWYTSYITINWYIHYLSDQRHKLEPTYINGSITAFIEANIEEQFLFFLHFYKYIFSLSWNLVCSACIQRYIIFYCQPFHIYIGMIFLSDSLMFFLGNDLTDSTLLFYTNKDLFPSIKWQIV